MRKILTSSDYVEKSWKNGLGLTREILLHPLFRLSMADLKESGPFSHFPGMHRILILLQGPPVKINSQPLSRFEIFEFSGDTDTYCEVSGEGKDFNLMLEADACLGKVKILNKDSDIKMTSDFFGIFSPEDEILVDGKRLSRESLFWAEEEKEKIVSIKSNGLSYFVITISYKKRI